MATYTPNYNLYLPGLGDGALNGKPWGYHINGNFTTIDSTLHTLQVAVTGLSGNPVIPAFTSSNNGQYLGVVGGALTWATVQALPTYSTSNNGQVLGISDGTPVWMSILTLPPYSTYNNGQVLTITAGAAVWATPTGSTYTDTYSTTEFLTNKVWIDGKPIYRKVVNFGAWPNGGTKQVAHGVSGITFVTYIGGQARKSDGTQIPATLAWTDSNSCIALWNDNTYIYMRSLVDNSAFTGYVVLEYTK